MIRIGGSLCQFGIGPGSGGGVTDDIVKRISVTYPTTVCEFETTGLCLVALNSSGSTESQLRSQSWLDKGGMRTDLLQHRSAIEIYSCWSHGKSYLPCLTSWLDFGTTPSFSFVLRANHLATLIGQYATDISFRIFAFVQFEEVGSAKDGDWRVRQYVQHPTIEINLRSRKLDDDAQLRSMVGARYRRRTHAFPRWVLNTN